jgi:hypothetical protein
MAALGAYRLLPAQDGKREEKILSGVEESWIIETFCHRDYESNPILSERLFGPTDKPEKRLRC